MRYVTATPTQIRINAAVRYLCVTITLAIAYVLASTVMYHVTVALHNAVNGHAH